MIIAYGIVAGITALVFLGAGGFKLVRSKAALAASGLGWVEDFAPPAIKLIGIAEVLGALGLVLPMLTRIAPWLSPVAAVALAVLMVGATVVHLRRRETPISVGPLVLAIASAVLGFLIL